MTTTNFSCVVDHGDKFQWQALLFVESLHRLAGVAYKDIYVHVVEEGLPCVPYFEERGVHLISAPRFGDGKYCNKITQIDSADRFSGDYVFLCDADVAFSGSLDSILVGRHEAILGKPVDFSNPPIDLLERALTLLGVSPLPPRVTPTLDGAPTLAGNMNGGFYGLPRRLLTDFGACWKQWAERLLSHEAAMKSLGRYYWHADQIAFCLALNETGHAYQELSLPFNCPTHVRFPAGGREITEVPRVLHYHSNFAGDGLLGPTGVRLVDVAIGRINSALGDLTRHPLNVLPSESAKASAPHRLLNGNDISMIPSNRNNLQNLLRASGLERASSVLEYRCGSAVQLEGLHVQSYRGLDPRPRFIDIARHRYPTLDFTVGTLDSAGTDKASLVLCLDLTGLVEGGESLPEVLAKLAELTEHRLVVCGHNELWGTDPVVPISGDSLGKLLWDTGAFRHVCVLGRHAGQDVIVADKTLTPAIRDPVASNDVSDELLSRALVPARPLTDLLYECAVISRSIFGWHTKHLPSLFEYPWVLDRLGTSLDGMTVADFHAGLSPLPYALAHRGAVVHTIDSHQRVVSLDAVSRANEWGFFDYSAHHENIHSHHAPLSADTFSPGSIDAWYSVSGVEHLPAALRRRMFDIFSETTRLGGRLLLSVDLQKRSRDLWNLNEGKTVDRSLSEHGNLGQVLEELTERGFTIVAHSVLPLPHHERVDIAFVEAVRAENPTIQVLYNSTSWRVTRPLRVAKEWLTATRQAPLVSAPRRRLRSALKRLSTRFTG